MKKTESALIQGDSRRDTTGRRRLPSSTLLLPAATRSQRSRQKALQLLTRGGARSQRSRVSYQLPQILIAVCISHVQHICHVDKRRRATADQSLQRFP